MEYPISVWTQEHGGEAATVDRSVFTFLASTGSLAARGGKVNIHRVWMTRTAEEALEVEAGRARLERGLVEMLPLDRLARMVSARKTVRRVTFEMPAGRIGQYWEHKGHGSDKKGLHHGRAAGRAAGAATGDGGAVGANGGGVERTGAAAGSVVGAVG